VAARGSAALVQRAGDARDGRRTPRWRRGAHVFRQGPGAALSPRQPAHRVRGAQRARAAGPEIRGPPRAAWGAGTGTFDQARGLGLARKVSVDLAVGFGELTAAFATPRHAALRTDQVEPAAHVFAVLRLQVRDHAAVISLDELAAGSVVVPVAPVAVPARVAPAVPERIQAV